METNSTKYGQFDLTPGPYSVRLLFQGEWLNLGGYVRVSREDAMMQAAHMRRHGDQVKVWHATEGWTDL